MPTNANSFSLVRRTTAGQRAFLLITAIVLFSAFTIFLCYVWKMLNEDYSLEKAVLEGYNYSK